MRPRGPLTDSPAPAADPDDGLGGVLGGEAQRPLAEVHLGLAHVAAEQHGVAGGGHAVGAPLGVGEADVGDVVLTTRVGAAGDVDAYPADLGQALLLAGQGALRAYWLAVRAGLRRAA